MTNQIILSQDQQNLIIQIWNKDKDNPPDLLSLTQLVFPEASDIDGRSVYGKAVKKFLASRALKITTKSVYKPMGRKEFTQDQKDYITNRAATMTSVDLARDIFQDPKLGNLSIEARSVQEYLASLPTQIKDATVDLSEPEEPLGEYRPPKTLERALNKINKFVLNAIDKDKITPKQRRDSNSLISYLHTYRFLHQISTYSTVINRDLFESSFIRYTYDKSDLTQEEVDQYIVLATEVVISSNIQETVEVLQSQIDQEVDSGNKIPMALVDAVTSARNEYNQCVLRQQKLLNDLKVKRSERLSNQIKENASILNLVHIWKDEESRIEMIKMADMRREVLKSEMARIASMDDLKSKVCGLTQDEVLNG